MIILMKFSVSSIYIRFVSLWYVRHLAFCSLFLFRRVSNIALSLSPRVILGTTSLYSLLFDIDLREFLMWLKWYPINVPCKYQIDPFSSSESFEYCSSLSPRVILDTISLYSLLFDIDLREYLKRLKWYPINVPCKYQIDPCFFCAIVTH